MAAVVEWLEIMWALLRAGVWVFVLFFVCGVCFEAGRALVRFTRRAPRAAPPPRNTPQIPATAGRNLPASMDEAKASAAARGYQPRPAKRCPAFMWAEPDSPVFTGFDPATPGGDYSAEWYPPLHLALLLRALDKDETSEFAPGGLRW